MMRACQPTRSELRGLNLVVALIRMSGPGPDEAEPDEWKVRGGDEEDPVNARDYFAARIEELWQAAGTPPLDTVARNAHGARSPSATKLSGKRISAWKTGTNVPRSFTELEGVILFLTQRARQISPEGTTPGLYDGRQWTKWWDAARKFSQSNSNTVDARPGLLGQVIDETLNPYDLEVHRAIGGNESDIAPALPAYIRRAHDLQLELIANEARSHNMLVTLVGGSSTGKTRACWEAIQSLQGWRLWHPLNPGRADALRNALERNLISPNTVIWLNEMQHYLITADSTGEAVAAGLRELLRSTSQLPVLILGTLWPEHWDVLTLRPEAAEADKHAQSRDLLTGRNIIVPESFADVEIAHLRTAKNVDNRVLQAISRPDRRVTQFLAGAFELTSRYEAAPASPRSLIDAAIDARRFGFNDIIPEKFLRSVAPGYMSDFAWSALNDDWFEDAIKYTRQPCLGVAGPLIKVHPRPDEPFPTEPVYRLADYLEEWGRQRRKYTIPPQSFWDAVTDSADSTSELLDIAFELNYRGRFRAAAKVYLIAAIRGDLDGFLYLADLRREAGDYTNAEKLYRIAMEEGAIIGYVRYTEMIGETDVEHAKHILKSCLNDLPFEAENRSIAWHHLSDVCRDTNDVAGFRIWLSKFVDKGDSSAAAELSSLNGASEDPRDAALLEELRKTADEARRSYREAEAAQKRLIDAALEDSETFEWAIRHYRDEATAEEHIGKHSHDLIMLGRLYGAHGDTEIAVAILLKAVNFLDGDAYFEGKISALAALADALRQAGRKEEAELASKYGLELDGGISSHWDALDEMPGILAGTIVWLSNVQFSIGRMLVS
jgi:tetratricopeptide (TPR) repeat protein